MKTWKNNIIFSIGATIALIFSFVACDNGNGKAHTHEWGKWTQTSEPTCTETGIETRVCSKDTTHKENRIGAVELGHDWNDWKETTTPTYIIEGEDTRYCQRSDCNHTETRKGVPRIAIISSTELCSILEELADNTADTPYTLSLRLNDLGENSWDSCDIAIVITNSDKYVSIDLSGSTFTSIGLLSFSNCSNLTSIIIPNSVITIGNSAFVDCSNLTSVNIPNSVTIIDYLAFSRCSSLTSVTIPDSVTKMGDRVFAECTNLTSITIPDSVTSIGAGAFNVCTSLTSIILPNRITIINGTFYNCTSLISITIPNSVTSISAWSFSNCSLTSIIIGADVILDISIDNPPSSSFGNNGFENIYNDGGKLAGTYTRPNISSTTWTRQ